MTLPQQIAEIMPVNVDLQQRDGTWKSYVLQSFTGTGSMVRFVLFQPSFFRTGRPAASAGSRAPKPRGSSRPLDERAILRALSFSGSTPARDQGRS